jgi:hypothetical protein
MGGGGEILIILLTLAALPTALVVVGTLVRRSGGRDVFKL